jgi:hypothetical protein
MTENQRVILGDALDTLKHVRDASKIKDKTTRLEEINELVNRVEDDIKTALRKG